MRYGMMLRTGGGMCRCEIVCKRVCACALISVKSHEHVQVCVSILLALADVWLAGMVVWGHAHCSSADFCGGRCALQKR